MKIIVGYDGSETVKRALERSAALAGKESRVVVVAVAEPYPPNRITIPVSRDAEALQRRRSDLEEARHLLAKRGIQAETVPELGDAADVLVDASKDPDLVIVGRRGVEPVRANGPRLSQLQGGSRSSPRRPSRAMRIVSLRV